MEEKDRLEALKVKLELAKAQIDLVKISLFGLLTIGAGLGTTLYYEYSKETVNKFFIVFLIVFGIIFGIAFLSYWILAYKKLQSVEKELKRWKL